ncbi:ribokinase [Streptomyces kaniharaensis]|uniref:Ribokinase n=1 Tax=Streptomyces kaniharaensis TaxID=212423 RepID=A0A6N7KUW9_9ACTN|nr:ribokinase [Streptomyces kaniharaensis]MQS15310.1 ribokinase [Streptomyces kaniharaensis]
MKLRPAGRVVVIGSVNVDRILRCPVLPSPGETVLVTDATQGFGGKGANQAVAAARMGATTRLVAKVGADADGRAALDDLRGADVDTGAVLTDAAAPTGQAVVMVDPAGENSIVVVPGANTRLTAAEVTAALTAARLLPRDVVLTSGEVAEECIRATAAALPADGTLWLHNAAPAGPLPDTRSTGRRPLVVANALEACQLTGASTVTDAVRALADLTDGAVITLGGAGALVAADGRITELPAPAVTAVDTTGAGDVFCGALAAELARSTPLVEAAAVAVAAGAFAVTALGARGALPRPADI